MSNLKLWDLVDKTDPKYTKEFTGKGGFKGTAVCAQSQRKKATEMLGLYGHTWGVKNESYEIMMLSDDFHNNILVYKAVMYYEYDDKRGEFPIVSDIAVWQYSAKYKNWSPTTDPHKKVRTDALTKGLSELGFNADVFMGEFDDNKYIRNQEHKQPEKPVVKINFESLEKNLSVMTTEEEVKNHMIKFKANSKDWTAEQRKDVDAIGTKHWNRVKSVGENVKDKFKGEEVSNDTLLMQD